jgi:hypothetical protein
LPAKPRKINTLYSKKEAEIAHFNDRDEKEDKKLYNESQVKIEEKQFLNNESDKDPSKTVKRENSLVKTKNNDTSVKKMPKNPFDFIWDTNNLMPIGDADRELSSLSRNKSNLGGKIAKLDDKEKALTNFNMNLNNLIDTNPSATQVENDGKTTAIKRKKKSKNKSNAEISNNSNRKSEFLSSQQTDSTTGLLKKNDLTLNLTQINTPDV